MLAFTSSAPDDLNIVIFDECTFDNNEATDSIPEAQAGGAVTIISTESADTLCVIFNICGFRGNVSPAKGGAASICALGDKIEFESTTFVDNVAHLGSDIYNKGGLGYLSYSTVSINSSAVNDIYLQQIEEQKGTARLELQNSFIGRLHKGFGVQS